MPSNSECIVWKLLCTAQPQRSPLTNPYSYKSPLCLDKSTANILTIILTVFLKFLTSLNLTNYSLPHPAGFISTCRITVMVKLCYSGLETKRLSQDSILIFLPLRSKALANYKNFSFLCLQPTVSHASFFPVKEF